MIVPPVVGKRKAKNAPTSVQIGSGWSSLNCNELRLSPAINMVVSNQMYHLAAKAIWINAANIPIDPAIKRSASTMGTLQINERSYRSPNGFLQRDSETYRIILLH